MLPSEKGFNQQLQICRARRKNESLYAALTFHAPSGVERADNSHDHNLRWEGLLVGMRSRYHIQPNTGQGVSPKETS